MRAIIAKEPGDPSVLTIIDAPVPIPGPKEILVKIHYAALNRADLLQRRGNYPAPLEPVPILGLEISGEVIALGSQVKDIHLNDRVFGLVKGGGYADYCVMDYRTALITPHELSDAEACAIPEAFLTAYEALFNLGQLKPHETVLIHAGASGIGTAAIQLAKSLPATVTTTVRSSEKIPMVKMLGADHIIHCPKNADSPTLPPSDVIFDVIGARLFKEHLDRLNYQGRLICLGLMGGAQSEINLQLLLQKSLHIHGFMMRTKTLAEKCQLVEQFKQNLLPLFENRTLRPVIDREFDFLEAAKAHEYMESNKNTGKILLKII